MSFWDSVRDFFSGGSSSRSDSGGGSSSSSQAPSSSPRPQQRPSIMSVQRAPEDPVQRVATRDMPQFGISAGDTSSEPSYSPFSLQGLTSTDPANVMRNIQGAERQAAAAPMGGGGDGSPAPAAPTAAPALAPVQPTLVEPGLTSVEDQQAQIDKAGESAAARARRLGLASTIATSPGGLLAGGEGTTRRRRSLMGGGGLIA